MTEKEQAYELQDALEWDNDCIYLIDKIISELESVKLKEVPSIQNRIDFWKNVKEEISAL